MKLWLYKIRHWEYWPVNLVYLPSLFLWCWYALKFRSLSFYRYSNPSIKNGGLYGDSKYEIYQLLQRGLYPYTLLINKEEKINIDLLLSEHRLSFPMIVKPDIGCRGVGVKKVYNNAELLAYQKEMKANFLIQELIDYPNEMGLFYWRLPNQKHGKISGITLKKFLTVEGNGFNTLEELLRKTPRYELQLTKLKGHLNLNEILPAGKKKCLVPFGNHNRGTEFNDGKMCITTKLEQTFDALLREIPGFYYGRLDIRYRTLEDLEQGRNFSIIEVNGAKSEPTHIYDPSHSFAFGQKEIFKHQNILQHIVKVNLRLSKTNEFNS